jgi:putative flavoprotein involved in K+ transport
VPSAATTCVSDLTASQVVVATGHNHTPYVPDWLARGGFDGELIHAGAYRNGRPYAGRDVLVIGAGSTGAEIAVDLVEHGAGRVLLAGGRSIEPEVVIAATG